MTESPACGQIVHLNNGVRSHLLAVNQVNGAYLDLPQLIRDLLDLAQQEVSHARSLVDARRITKM